MSFNETIPVDIKNPRGNHNHNHNHKGNQDMTIQSKIFQVIKLAGLENIKTIDTTTRGTAFVWLGHTDQNYGVYIMTNGMCKVLYSWSTGVDYVTDKNTEISLDVAVGMAVDLQINYQTDEYGVNQIVDDIENFDDFNSEILGKHMFAMS